MGKRSIIIKARIDEDEHKYFLRKLIKSKLSSSSEYIRQAVLTSQIKPPPPQELIDVLNALLHEYKAQGNNLNQIAFNLNASGFPLPYEFKVMQEEQQSLGVEIRATLRKLNDWR